MNITTEQVQGRVPVTILRPVGDVDSASYRDLIEAGRVAKAGGAQYVLIDLRQTPYMGSSGLVALHSLALIFKGEPPPDPEAGWRALHAATEASGSGAQTRVKLLGPTPAVDRVLELSGLKPYFEVHTDQQAAVNSF